MDNSQFGVDGKTLAERLAEGRFSSGEAIGYALLLAESLRRAHEEGQVYGVLTPSAIRLTESGLELQPPAGPPGVTPYTAPELLLGRPADARSDIFSFGAIFYELLTGCQAFTGATPEELALLLKTGQPPSTGDPVPDRIVRGCLAKDPAIRWRQMQKVSLALRLLSGPGAADAAKAAPPVQHDLRPPAEPNPPLSQPSFPPSSDLAALRGELQQSESRLAARIQLNEMAVAALNRTVADALESMRSEISTLAAQVAALEERARTPGAGPIPEAALVRIEQTLHAFGSRMEVLEKASGALQDRVARTEHESAAAKQQVGILHSSIAEDFLAFEQSLQKQEKAVDSARMAMAQTDDLVERLVEALEALQATVLQRTGELSHNVN